MLPAAGLDWHLGCPSNYALAFLLFTLHRAFMDRGRALLSGRREAAVTEALAMEIESLRKLKTKALKARYRELFGEESRSSNHVHLFRRIAWRLQARAEGDLSERARRRMLELADDHALRLRAPRSFWHSAGFGPD